METLVIDLAYGTTTGRNHRIENALRPNQDALHIVRAPGCTAGVVTDGCGGEPHSEFGAMLGSRLVANTIVTEVAEKGSVNDIDWERVRQDVLAQLRTLANTMAGVQSFTQFVMEYLLFSIVGFVADNTHCAFFYVGDGIVVVNGSVTTLEPQEGNQPVYLAYNLVETSLNVSSAELLGFSITALVPLEDLHSFLVGTDGVGDIITNAQSNLPGMQQPMGDISQFWLQDPYYKNTEAISRRLNMGARRWPKANPDPGLLPDDTTLIVGRPNLQGTGGIVRSEQGAAT